MVARRMKTNRISPNLLRFLLGLYVLASVGYWLPGMIDHATWVLNLESHTAAPFDYDLDTRVIDKVYPEAKAAGVTEGATLESLNGVPYSAKVWDEIINTAHPDDMMDVGFRRKDGSSGAATITLTALKSPITDMPRAAIWIQEILYGLVALACLVMGYWIVLAKPTDGTAWLLLILLTFPSVFFFSHHGFGTGIGAFTREFWYLTLQLLASPVLLLFGIYFPERSRVDAKLPWLKWMVLIPLFVCLLAFYPLVYGERFGSGNSVTLDRLGTWIDHAVSLLNLICVLLYLILTLDKLRSASTADARRRLRVLTVGMSIGVGSLLFFFILLPHLGVKVHSGKHPWLATVGIILFLAAPFTLAYVVLVQRAMDVRILVRMGARYALAKATLWAVQYVLLAIVAVELLLPVLGKKQTNTSNLLGPLIFFGLVILLRMGLHKRIQHWLDRRFFREAYDAERVLNELAEEVRRYTETEPLLETVARCVAETLHVDQIAMLLRRGEYFVLQQSIGIAAGGTLTLPVQSSSVRYLTNSNEPARLYREDPDAWYLMAGTAERYALDKLNAELLLPLPGRNRMMGVMALGPKRSEAAYSSADMKLLQALASQTGLALEVSELARSLAAEAAQRERANREMEIAREVQERLFPQEMPELPGAKIAGYCRPALGVGGDYYDVIDLGDGRVGLAVGDVSGKGISAALLMASLRASLRGVTLDGPRDFAKLMHKVNRLVYEASASNRYATFFFASYDPATRRLECVNAGHNPPVLLRGQETIRLEAGGPVVGLLPSAPYSEQSLTLEPGDLLILYTDGISEAMTKDDEEWGEERMIAAARASIHKPANVVLDDLFVAADTFTAGAPQHDDMTLLVLKLES
jgi:sigma-B regulation protein RsbU (phosphoserine phosphatase)